MKKMRRSGRLKGSRTVIFFSLLILCACQVPYTETEAVEIDTIMEESKVSKKVYKNDKTPHIPADIAGVWRVEETGDIWELGADGISQPISCSLYPNPVTPDMFLAAAEGQTKEIVDTGYYSFSGSAKFSHNGNMYYGECKVSIDAAAGILNGRAAVRD